MDIKTVLGVFQDNEITDIETGEIISCITYKSVREIIQGKTGFYSMKKSDYGDWIVFQYVLTD